MTPEVDIKSKEVEIDVNISTERRAFEVETSADIHRDMHVDEQYLHMEADANRNTYISDEVEWIPNHQEVCICIEMSTKWTCGEHDRQRAPSHAHFGTDSEIRLPGDTDMTVKLPRYRESLRLRVIRRRPVRRVVSANLRMEYNTVNNKHQVQYEARLTLNTKSPA